MNIYSQMEHVSMAKAVPQSRFVWLSDALRDSLLYGKTALSRSWNAYKLHKQILCERAQLSALTDQQLADIGVTREQALLESNKHWTDVPVNRSYR